MGKMTIDEKIEQFNTLCEVKDVPDEITLETNVKLPTGENLVLTVSWNHGKTLAKMLFEDLQN